MSFNSHPPAPSSRTPALSKRRTDNPCSLGDLPDSPVSQSSKCGNPTDFPSILTPMQGSPREGGSLSAYPVSMYPDSPSSLASAPESIAKSDQDLLKEFGIPSCHVVLRRWKSDKDRLLENGISKCLFIRLCRLKPSEIQRHVRVVPCEGFNVFYHSRCVKELACKNLSLGTEAVDLEKLYEKSLTSGFHSMNLNRFKDIAQRSIFDFRHRSELKRKKEEELKQKLRFYYRKDSYVLIRKEDAKEGKYLSKEDAKKGQCKINLRLKDCVLSPDPMLDSNCKLLSREEAKRKGMQRIYYTNKCYVLVPTDVAGGVCREDIQRITNCCIVMNLSGSSLSPDSMHRLFDSVNDKTGEILNRRNSCEEDGGNMSSVPDSTAVFVDVEEAGASLVERTKCGTDSGNFSLSPNEMTGVQESITESEDGILRNRAASCRGNDESASFDSEESDASVVERTKCGTDSGNFSLSPNDVTRVQESMTESEDGILQSRTVSCKENNEDVSCDSEEADASIVERTKYFTDSGNFSLSPNDRTEVQESISESEDGVLQTRESCKRNYKNVSFDTEEVDTSLVEETKCGTNSGNFFLSPNDTTRVQESITKMGDGVLQNIGVGYKANYENVVPNSILRLSDSAEAVVQVSRTSCEIDHGNLSPSPDLMTTITTVVETGAISGQKKRKRHKSRTFGDLPIRVSGRKKRKTCKPIVYLDRETYNLFRTSLRDREHFNAFLDCNISYYFRFAQTTNGGVSPVPSCTKETDGIRDNPDELPDGIRDPDSDKSIRDPDSDQSIRHPDSDQSIRDPTSDQLSNTQNFQEGGLQSNFNLFPSHDDSDTSITESHQDPISEFGCVDLVDSNSSDSSDSASTFSEIFKSDDSDHDSSHEDLWSVRNKPSGTHAHVNNLHATTEILSPVASDTFFISRDSLLPSSFLPAIPKTRVASDPSTGDDIQVLDPAETQELVQNQGTNSKSTGPCPPTQNCPLLRNENSSQELFVYTQNSPTPSSTLQSPDSHNSPIWSSSQDVLPAIRDSSALCTLPQTSVSDALASHPVTAHDSPNACSTSALAENGAFTPAQVTAYDSPNAGSTSTLTESDASTSPYVEMQHRLNACLITKLPLALQNHHMPVSAHSQNDDNISLPRTDASDTDDYSNEEGVRETDTYNFANGTNEQTDDNFFSAAGDQICIDFARVKQKDSENDMDIQETPFLACLEIVKGASDNSSSNTVIVNNKDGEYNEL